MRLLPIKLVLDQRKLNLLKGWNVQINNYFMFHTILIRNCLLNVQSVIYQLLKLIVYFHQELKNVAIFKIIIVQCTFVNYNDVVNLMFFICFAWFLTLLLFTLHLYMFGFYIHSNRKIYFLYLFIYFLTLWLGLTDAVLQVSWSVVVSRYSPLFVAE